MTDTQFAASRRRFLRETFAFSALAALGSMPGVAAPHISDGAGEVNLFAIGDWGYDKQKEPQKVVAAALKKYALDKKVNAEGFLFLGDNWYGALEGGAQAERWQTEFEQIYPADVFNCPAWAILGNHDYQKWPESKVDAELEYAWMGKSRWTMPSRYYRFEFPKKKPLITFLALDTNVPHEGGKSNGVDFTMTPEEYAAQLKWLETELQKPRTTPYLVVLGHHPVYSNGRHGDRLRWFATGTRCYGSTRRISISRDMTMTCSTWSLRIIRRASSCRAVAARICTRSRLIRRSAGRLRRGCMGSAICL
jgi:hypothetical protein